jgi:predicted permease
MPLRPRILSLWRNVSRRDQMDRDLDEELRAHLDMLIEEKLSSGMSQEEARRAALLEFGGVEQTKEQVRASRTGFLLETLWKDLCFGFRMLVRNPGFASAAVVSLALGIGATTAVFSIFDTIFLRPLPYPESDRLMAIPERRLDTPEPDGWDLASAPTFLDWKRQSQSFEEMAAYADSGQVFNGRERAEQVLVRHVSEGYLHMLGARACQGRLLIPDDYSEGQPARAVLSYPAWQRLFGSDPTIIGNTIRAEGGLLQVIGVMCPEYRPEGADKIDFWVRNFLSRRETRMWWVIGRLKPGISVEKAQAEMEVIEARLARQYPEQKGYGARVLPLQVYGYGWLRNQFLTFFGAVVVVLLIACMNVANLLLERGASRGKEMAVRASLGAGRARLVRQMLTESLLLSFLGAGLGLLLAYAGVRFAVYTSPEYAIPRADEISVNLRMLGFTLLVALLTGWLFGLFPALRASKLDLTESLKEGGHRSVAHFGGRRFQNVLVIGQIALSLVLLVGAGLMIHGVWRQLRASPGFNTDHLAQISIHLRGDDYTESLGNGSVFMRLKPKAALTIEQVTARLRALPGVQAVNVTGSGVFSSCNPRPMSAEGPPPRQDYGPATCCEPVSPGYFGMLGIPVLKGRVFTERDSGSSPPVAIISQSAAQHFFPSQDPIGKMIYLGIWESEEFERRQVVGVVTDVRWTVYEPTRSALYYPYSQLPARFHWRFAEEQLDVKFLVCSGTDPAALVRVMDRVVPEVARDVLISAAETVDHTRWSKSQDSRFVTWLFVAFAGTALTLAAVGVFGVMSYDVTRRTHEMGIRMALGAHSRNVIGLILRNGLIMTLIGLGIGLGSSLALARFLESRLGELQMTELKATDPPTLTAVCLVLALAALLACYIPARRAARMNPLTSLRYE